MRYLKDNNGTFTVIHKDGVTTFSDDSSDYLQLKAAVESSDELEFMDLLGQRTDAADWSDGEFDFDTFGNLSYNGFSIDPALQSQICWAKDSGFGYEPFLKYFDNCNANPSVDSVKDLYRFLSGTSLPITEDGEFLAYKSVTTSKKDFTDKLGREVKVGDYVDVHSRTIRNNVGDVITMPREHVATDRTNCAGAGLHVGTHKYITSYRGEIKLLVKVNPMHVVAVPIKEPCKIRTCQYTVFGLYTGELTTPVIETY